jgi:CBS domain-containing protein
MTVETILRQKGTDVATIEPDARIRRAADWLRVKNIGALVVTSEKAVLGLISERDRSRIFSLRRDCRIYACEGIMSRPPTIQGPISIAVILCCLLGCMAQLLGTSCHGNAALHTSLWPAQQPSSAPALFPPPALGKGCHGGLSGCSIAV